MVGSVGYHAGGIRSLAQLVTEHGGAVRYELLRVGRHLEDLGTTRLSWLDIQAVVQHAPPGNAIARAVAPDASGWGISDYLLAAIANLLATANWQRQQDDRAPRPKPILPPGIDDPATEGYGSDAIPLDQFNDWWDS